MPERRGTWDDQAIISHLGDLVTVQICRHVIEKHCSVPSLWKDKMAFVCDTVGMKFIESWLRLIVPTVYIQPVIQMQYLTGDPTGSGFGQCLWAPDSWVIQPGWVLDMWMETLIIRWISNSQCVNWAPTYLTRKDIWNRKLKKKVIAKTNHPLQAEPEQCAPHWVSL